MSEFETAEVAGWVDGLVEWLRQHVEAAGAAGVVFGLSGGLDSAVVAALCRRAVGDASLGLILPCESDPDDAVDARLVADALQLRTVTVDLSPALQQLAGDLSAASKDGLPGAVQAATWDAARTNMKPRLRMTACYYFANALNYLVAGTDNRCELEIGYFTKYGDGGVDLQPIASFLKREVRALGKYLGVPDRILQRRPGAGLTIGQVDEDEFGFSYDVLDRYLAGEPGVPEAVVQRIESMRRSSAHKRALPPIGPRRNVTIG